MDLYHIGSSDHDGEWREVENWNWAKVGGGMYV